MVHVLEEFLILSPHFDDIHRVILLYMDHEPFDIRIVTDSVKTLGLHDIKLTILKHEQEEDFGIGDRMKANELSE